MAKKPIKIKRYHGYLGQRRRPIVTFFLMLVWAVLVATLVVIGIAIYEPVMEYIAQRGFGTSQESSSLPESSSSPSSLSSEVSSSQPEETQPDQQSVRSVYLAHSVLTDQVKLDEFLEAAKKGGASAVVVDIKNENGSVMHLSQVKTATDALAVSDFAVDMSDIAKAISERGLRPIARVYAFEDHVSSYSLRRMACGYLNETMLWYDNEPLNGGKPWLNPYAQEAQNYVLQLAVESGEIGFDEVILAGFQFPWGYQLENVYFGAEAANTPKADILEDLALQIQERLEGMGVEMSIMIRAADIIESNDFTYGEGNPLDRFQCPIYIDFSLSHLANRFSGQYIFGDVVLESTADPSAVVSAAIQALSPSMDTGKLKDGIYGAVIECDGNNAQISSDVLRREAETLSNAGMKDIFFNSEFSSYPARTKYDSGL